MTDKNKKSKSTETKSTETKSTETKSKETETKSTASYETKQEVEAPFTLHPTVKIILIVIFTAYLVLSALKTFTPDIYQDIQPYLGKLDKIIPALNKPIGKYIVP